MTVLEIIAGVLMIVACLLIIWLVLAQESKGQGLSSVITGTEMMSNESRGRTKEARQIKFTRIFAIAFFVLAIAVNVISVFTK